MDSNHTCLAIISLGSALEKNDIEKKVVKHSPDNMSDFSSSSDESDESDEE